MKECKCGGIIGKLCRENATGECWLLWSVRDGSLEDGAENDLHIAKKYGKLAGIKSALGHLHTIRDFQSFDGCQKIPEAIDGIQENLRAIRNLPGEEK